MKVVRESLKFSQHDDGSHVAAFDEAGGTQRPVEECHERDADGVVAVAHAPHQRCEQIGRAHV